MRASIALTSFLLSALLVSGCATLQPQFSVRVDSISGATADRDLYILLPGNKDTKAEDLQFKEYAAYANRALIKQGFVPAESLEKANIAIFLPYGVGDLQHRLAG